MASEDIYNEVPSSSIPLTSTPDPKEISDIAQDMYMYFDRMHPSAALKLREGSSISVNSKYTVTDYITDMCTAVHLYLNKYNGTISIEDKIFFKQYIDALTGLCKVMKKFDFNVAEPEFFAYIYGYNLKIITEYYGNSKYRQSEIGNSNT
jgi:hypothetical protein